MEYTAVYGDSDINLGLTTEGESAVTYTTTDNSVATAADGKLHIVGAGDAKISLSMAESTNYLSENAEINVTVHPAALTITAEDKTTDYGTDAPAFTVKYDGFCNGDKADKEGVFTGTLDFDCTYQKGDATNGNVGEYDITPKGLAAKNYEITYVTGTLTVTKVASNISIESVAAKTYGDAAFDLTVTKSGSTAAPSYTSSDASVITVDNDGKVTITGTGTAIVTVVLPADHNYNQAEDSVGITVNKKALTVTAENKNITYGDEAPAYSVVYDGFVNGETQDTTGVLDGTLTFSCDYRKADATENTNSNAGTYAIVPSGLTSANYEIRFVEGTLTVKKASVAPNRPGTTMAPAHSTEKVGNIALPEGWSWKDTDKDTALADGVAVTATAVYTGADKGNYETESVSITITRSKCEHRHTEIRNQKTATCTQTGYIGDTYCTDCKTLLEIGRELAALGHDYKGTVTKQSTTTEEGIMTYTCSRCGQSYTESIAKLKADDQNPKPDTKPTPAVKPAIEVNPFAESKPYLRDDSGKEGWDVISAQLDNAGTGDTVTVVMNGTTVVPKNVIDSIQGEDITLVLDMGNGISWKINGQDITGASGDIDFGVTIGANAGKNIPVDVINNVTGERYSMNLTLAYDGKFGFTATLTINMEAKNAGLYANLFYYNAQTGELEFVSAGQIDAEGNADLAFTHASDYTIVIDETVLDGKNNESVTSVENAEAAEEETVPAVNEENQKGVSTWNSTIIFIIGICILAIAFGAVIHMRKKRGSEEE